MSMVEVMIGLLLLALLLVPSLNAINNQFKMVNATREHIQAAFVAQKVIEMFRAHSFRLISEAKADESEKSETFEHKLKNDDFYKKHVLNNVVYEVVTDSVKILPVWTSEAAENEGKNSAKKPNAYVFQFEIKYEDSRNKIHTLPVTTALTRRE